MRLGLALTLLSLLPLTSTIPAIAQRTARVIVIVVDDIGYRPEDLASAGQLLRILRDEVMTDSDLISIVSTGRSSVAVDLRFVGDRSRINEAIRKFEETPSSGGVLGVVAGSDMASRQRAAHVTFGTVSDLLKGLAQVQDRPKQLIFLSSQGTSTAVLEAALATGEAAATLTRELSELATLARRADVVIHTIDPGDLGSPRAIRALR